MALPATQAIRANHTSPYANKSDTVPSRRRLLAAQALSQARPHHRPVRIREPSDGPDFPPQQRNGKQAKVRRRPQPCLPPIKQYAIGRRHRPRNLAGDQADHDVRSVTMLCLRRKHDGGPRLCTLRARKPAHDNIAWLQLSSRPSSSNRRTADAVASARSSSLHESDH